MQLSDSAADTKTRAASSAAVGVEDIGFWLLVSAYVFRQMYCTTYGSIRWFFVLGIAAGLLTAVGVQHLLKRIFRKLKKQENLD